MTRWRGLYEARRAHTYLKHYECRVERLESASKAPHWEAFWRPLFVPRRSTRTVVENNENRAARL